MNDLNHYDLAVKELSMTFAYADPPYYGCGKKHYGDKHPEAEIWDTKQTHLDLIKKLTTDYPDGWALSLNPKDLAWQLPACPDDCRVGVWAKPFHQIRPTLAQYAWEPVVWRTSKKGNPTPMTRDWLECPPTMKKGLVGAKPEAFNRWVLNLLGYEEGDSVDDLFPGTGGLAKVIAQGCLI